MSTTVNGKPKTCSHCHACKGKHARSCPHRKPSAANRKTDARRVEPPVPHELPPPCRKRIPWQAWTRLLAKRYEKGWMLWHPEDVRPVPPFANATIKECQDEKSAEEED